MWAVHMCVHVSLHVCELCTRVHMAACSSLRAPRCRGIRSEARSSRHPDTASLGQCCGRGKPWRSARLPPSPSGTFPNRNGSRGSLAPGSVPCEFPERRGFTRADSRPAGAILCPTCVPLTCVPSPASSSSSSASWPTTPSHPGPSDSTGNGGHQNRTSCPVVSLGLWPDSGKSYWFQLLR